MCFTSFDMTEIKYYLICWHFFPTWDSLTTQCDWQWPQSAQPKVCFVKMEFISMLLLTVIATVWGVCGSSNTCFFSYAPTPPHLPFLSFFFFLNTSEVKKCNIFSQADNFRVQKWGRFPLGIEEKRLGTKQVVNLTWQYFMNMTPEVVMMNVICPFAVKTPTNQVFYVT